MKYILIFFCLNLYSQNVSFYNHKDIHIKTVELKNKKKVLDTLKDGKYYTITTIKGVSRKCKLIKNKLKNLEYNSI